MPNTVRTTSKYLAWASLLLAAIAVVGLLMGYRSPVQPLVVGALSFLALFCMRHPVLKSYAFTVWVFAFVSASVFYPQAFLKWGGYELKNLIVPLIQIIMFGMGTTLSVADFARVLKMPWPVFIGFVSHYVIMPLTGLTLAKTFGFPQEVAAGVVLIGCCPSGVASNVMAYLGGGNVALSVTVTSCSTLAAPLMTPILMQHLAGRFVEVEPLKMMLEIVNMIIVPIVAGLIANRILYSRRSLLQRGRALLLLGAVGVLLAAGIGFFVPASVFAIGKASLKIGLVVGLLLIGTVALTKLVIDVWLQRPGKWMDKALPIVSMVAICCIIAVITATSIGNPKTIEELKQVGALLVIAVMIHNAVGYCVGYWLARAVRLEESACRTVAFEVGMQNGGMASALAMSTFNSVQAALAPAIFGPWQNISGSILATWWHRKPVEAVGTVTAGSKFEIRNPKSETNPKLE
jgi:bile acid:Na+ symporter, BASS family